VPADSEDIFVDIFQRAVSAARFFVSKTMDFYGIDFLKIEGDFHFQEK